MIEDYEFGKIVIDNQIYKNDVIVFPDFVQPNWWREKGHYLQVVDIRNAVEKTNPIIVVIGTGKFGVMRIAPEVSQFFEKRRITVHSQPTGKAVVLYNRFFSQGDNVLGMFHLTC
jgi:hypothetical protein